MRLKTYIVIAVVALFFVATALWMGPWHGVVITLGVIAAGLFYYLIGRLFMAIVHRLER